MKKILLILVASTLILNTYASDKHKGDPSHNKWNITSVKWIRSTNNRLKDDDRHVVLIGKIKKQINGDTYLFNDGTGDIELDSHHALPVGKAIVVRGTLDQAWLNMGFNKHNADLDVKSWRYNKHVK
ncbi:MAG: NirD/YgiW/YdeI family stress tolerance protein [Verrucomicrobiota bacterium]|nr:NirD/YgiW/YdeI family stress tolerance protein [Verrucomicrobiota bacterium]